MGLLPRTFSTTLIRIVNWPCTKSGFYNILSFLRSLRLSVISALNISRDYRYAEITEIRRDRRKKLCRDQQFTFALSSFRIYHAHGQKQMLVNFRTLRAPH
jgi:hypothetical protein